MSSCHFPTPNYINKIKIFQISVKEKNRETLYYMIESSIISIMAQVIQKSFYR